VGSELLARHRRDLTGEGAGYWAGPLQLLCRWCYVEHPRCGAVNPGDDHRATIGLKSFTSAAIDPIMKANGSAPKFADRGCNGGVVLAMAMIEFQEGAIQVDATLIAEGLGIEPSLVQARMRDGAITSLCERGSDEDSGRYRLTFFSGNRRFRIVVDERGNVIQRSATDVSDRPLPVSARKPGA